MNYEEHFKQSCELRDNYWKSVGEVDPDVIAHLINPAFMGGPKWPSLRQAFKTIRSSETVIIASDGLSDPYDDYDTNKDNQAYNGLGFEFYVETSDKIDVIQNSWQFDIVYQMSQFAAANPNILNLLNQYTFLTTELYNVKAPVEYINESERVGVIVGLPSETIPESVKLSIEEVRIVNIRLLTLDELNYVVANGVTAREELAQEMIRHGNPTTSFVARESFRK